MTFVPTGMSALETKPKYVSPREFIEILFLSVDTDVLPPLTNSCLARFMPGVYSNPSLFSLLPKAVYTAPPVGKPALSEAMVPVKLVFFVASLVLSTLPRPTCALVTPCGLLVFARCASYADLSAAVIPLSIAAI